MRDFLVIGAGSSGAVLAAELARREAGSVLLLEAGPSDTHPLVRIPFGLIWLMGSNRDWRFSATQGNRYINVPRGRMVGGSGSINSMVWFRGRADDFNTWQIPGWSYDEITPAFDAVEAELRPRKYTNAHPLSAAFETLFGDPPVSPEQESAGLFSHNMENGKRRSAATAFLNNAHHVALRTDAQVVRLLWTGDRATGCVLTDGSEIRVRKGVVLCAGSIASPAILMRSGVGPANDLQALGIDPRHDSPEIGQNLHDHPGIGLHFEGPATGYGLEARQWPHWALAPLRYLATKRGQLASPTCEAGMFFNARGTGNTPDVQTHFIPFFLAHEGSRYQRKAGYFADVCLCRPKSRGALRLTSVEPNAPPHIDLGLLKEESDLDTLQAGLARLRELLHQLDFGPRRGREVFPGETIEGDSLRDHIRQHIGTAYHPVGTVKLGGPLSARLKLQGCENLWVADASIMPQVTSANTNAPSMMIGWKGAEFIAEDAA